ncbi:MAG: metallophosphoesterase [Paracoccus sp. (in: a-proteobacteria)]|nr:metallophosphoesterase [Paracoccus sp. (in: a-proteobacteria)]
MSGFDFDFHGLRLTALSSGALLSGDHATLIAADLHLGRSLRSTRDGGLPLPPFETIDTLTRLETEVQRHRPRRVVLLGDSFDSDAVRMHLPSAALSGLDRIAAATDLVLVSGNHDPGAGLPAQLWLGEVALRHIAGEGPDISGHYHPKLRIAGASFPVFLISHRHIVLPAFGTYTGGMFWSEPALQRLMPSGIAIAATHRPFAIPLAHKRVT